MGSGVFIVGTDTGVGKTVVTAGLLHCLRKSGIDAVPMKPIQTGGVSKNKQLSSPDLNFCLQVIEYQPSVDEMQLMNPYCFEPACSPHLAAKIENVRIDIQRIDGCLQELLARHQSVIVEGAGGVLVPINESKTVIDIIQELALPVVVVARRGLGTINHTLLTLNELRRQSVEVLGVILNESEPDNSEMIARDNTEIIQNMGDIPVLGTLDYLCMPSEDALRREIACSFRQMVLGCQIVLDRLRKAL